jgi:hypothetical protein
MNKLRFNKKKKAGIGQEACLCLRAGEINVAVNTGIL